MKSILIGLCWLALFFCDAFSQDKVLIVTRDSFGFPNKDLGLPAIQNALAHHYGGVVDTKFGVLPDTLTAYEAIFTDLSFLKNGDSIFIATALENLTNYTAGGGRLYIEVSLYTIFYRNFDTDNPAYEEYPLFRDYVGVTQITTAAAEIHGIDTIRGVPGYFSDGLRYTRETNPLESNASALFLDGDITGVLRAEGYYWSGHLGWQYEKQNAKVVWHWPIVPEHYDEFIGRVVCNYFGLCEPLDVAPAEISTSRISFDPISNSINVGNVSPNASVELYSVLGVRLLHTQAGNGVVRVPDLPRGSYFVVVRDGNAVKTATIVR